MIGKLRVRVAGAGAFGLFSALALADAGCRVDVYDPAAEADNASGVAAGMLAPGFETLLDPTSSRHFEILKGGRDLWPAHAARLGIGIDRRGALWVGEDARALILADVLQRLGCSAERLAGAELAQRAPGLAPDVAAGVYTDADWRLDARQAIAALRRRAETSGVAFHRAPVPLDGDGLLVIATGAARDLVGLAPELAHISPIKGHILRMGTLAPAELVVRGEGIYIAPAADGGCIVGATMEPGLDDRNIDLARAAPLARIAGRLFPELVAAPFTIQAGVRAATPDGLPMVGRSASPDVILAVGARRNGWLLAPLVAELVTASVLGDPMGPVADIFDPGRFGALT